VEDLGAGSRVSSAKKRSVKQIAKNVLKPKKYSRLLFRIAKYYQPKLVIELGTSLGITTAYLSKGAPLSKIISVEGSNSVAEIAESNFNKLGCNNIQLIRGNFDVLLPQILREIFFVDLAFIDGNHQFQPTMNYFKQFLSKAKNDTILIFDDIHWSKEMEKAWEEIKNNGEVRCTIDLFFIGLVFFRAEFKEKRHFTIRY
jgi:predicted O-methyltransferase YrrM